MLSITISRKTIAAGVAAGVGALLPLLHVYHVSPEVQSLISAAEAAAAAFVVGDGVKYANYLAKRLGVPVEFDAGV